MSDEESELAGYDTSIRDPSEGEIAEAKARWERMSSRIGGIPLVVSREVTPGKPAVHERPGPL